MWDNTVAIFRHIEDGSWSAELLCWNYTSECRGVFFARIFVYNRLEHLTNEKLHLSLLMLRSKIVPLKYRFVAYNNRAFPLKKMKNLRIVSGLYWSSFRHTLKIYPFFWVLIIWLSPCRNHLGWIITVRKAKFYQLISTILALYGLRFSCTVYVRLELK